MRLATVALTALALFAVSGCAETSSSSKTAASAVKPTSAALPEGAPREPLAWAELNAETFARAKRERKYVVLDGAAEWCHWCHVMEATTYHDPRVREILDKHFIAVKVDIDSRPDVAERYGDWGWPATILFSPDATEIGKHRGYMAPDEFLGVLNDVVASHLADRANAVENASHTKAPTTPLPEETLTFIESFVAAELDDFYDERQGGWGRMQKAPLGFDNEWALFLAKKGDSEAKERALFTLEKQSKLIDPVWGGIYQYSVGGDWDHAHFEKLMTFQAPALANYADEYALTKDPKALARARAMIGYIDRFMKSPEGGFYTTQDADVNAHDMSKPFMSGHDYYALGEDARRAHGLPRIDSHEYGRENGLAMAAYVSMFQAANDAAALASAERAAKRIWTTHATPQGGITHDTKAASDAAAVRVLYLSDNAAFGFGLMRLFEATKSGDALAHATAIADFLMKEMFDDDGGGFFAATKDPDAAGVFGTRRVPFEDNVMVLRFLARLTRASAATDPARAATYTRAIGRTLRAIATPDEIRDRGRMIGDFLLALEETKGVR